MKDIGIGGLLNKKDKKREKRQGESLASRCTRARRSAPKAMVFGARRRGRRSLGSKEGRGEGRSMGWEKDMRGAAYGCVIVCMCVVGVSWPCISPARCSAACKVAPLQNALCAERCLPREQRGMEKGAGREVCGRAACLRARLAGWS